MTLQHVQCVRVDQIPVPAVLAWHRLNVCVAFAIPCQTCLQCHNIRLVNVKDASIQTLHECLCTHKHMTIHS